MLMGRSDLEDVEDVADVMMRRMMIDADDHDD